LCSKDFFEMLRQGKESITTAVNPLDFEEAFGPILAAGEDVLYLAFSSGLSSTYGVSLMAWEEMKARYPGRRVICIDTLCASMGQGLLAFYAARMRLEGKGLEETATWVEENRLHLCHWFTVDDLIHLHRGGRVGAVAAYAGTVLGIKPLLHVDDAGHLVPIRKVRGQKQMLEALVAQLKQRGRKIEEQTIFICQADATQQAEELAEAIRTRFAVQDIQIGPMGPIIGSHAGPGALALFFLGDQR
ncbi:MAG: DegV family protein, partial [Oscillospiraceae bacterium]